MISTEARVAEDSGIMEYRKALKHLAAKNDSFVFSNRGAQHAAAVMATIFDYAQSYVYIYANDMDGKISNDPEYMSSLQRFLAKDDSVLRIVLDKDPQDDPVSKSLAVKYLREIGVADIRIASDEFKSQLQSMSNDGLLYHFSVADGKMVRLESDNENHVAPYCTFNDPETVNVLEKVFDENYESLKKARI